ncbi:MAG: 16S rRNA (guanine(527)-N(7))-methyltransferase RsmG [Desulfopila sp.]|nr:16S rRNA (guanine(527)-N(7))-methyltransferase RsmG [Desulfopila sp.]
MKSRPEDISGLLREGCEYLRLSLHDDAFLQLEKYYNELVRWNAKMNLIARNQSVLQIIENHFIDSLVLLSLLPRQNVTLVDVGSGAGFPGLVCKAGQPGMRLVLVEPRLKRVSFLRHIQRTLQMDAVTVIADRLEDVAVDRLACSHITARAVAEIGPFLEMVEGICSPTARVLCMKGPKWREELESASSSLVRMGMVLSEVVERRLPFSGAERAVLSFCRESQEKRVAS